MKTANLAFEGKSILLYLIRFELTIELNRPKSAGLLFGGNDLLCNILFHLFLHKWLKRAPPSFFVGSPLQGAPGDCSVYNNMADPSTTNSNRIRDPNKNHNTITSTNPIIPKNLNINIKTVRKAYKLSSPYLSLSKKGSKNELAI